MAINSHSPNGRVGRRAPGNGDETISSQRFNSSDLGLTVGRTTTTPADPAGILVAVATAVRTWARLASGDRENGGAIVAAGRTAARLASVLVDTHGADAADVAAYVAAVRDGNDDDAGDIGARIIAATTTAPDADADADAPDADADAPTA